MFSTITIGDSAPPYTPRSRSGCRAAKLEDRFDCRPWRPHSDGSEEQEPIYCVAFLTSHSCPRFDVFTFTSSICMGHMCLAGHRQFRYPCAQSSTQLRKAMQHRSSQCISTSLSPEEHRTCCICFSFVLAHSSCNFRLCSQ